MKGIFLELEAFLLGHVFRLGRLKYYTIIGKNIATAFFDTRRNSPLYVVHLCIYFILGETLFDENGLKLKAKQENAYLKRPRLKAVVLFN